MITSSSILRLFKFGLNLYFVNMTNRMTAYKSNSEESHSTYESVSVRSKYN